MVGMLCALMGHGNGVMIVHPEWESRTVGIVGDHATVVAVPQVTEGAAIMAGGDALFIARALVLKHVGRIPDDWPELPATHPLYASQVWQGPWSAAE